MRTDLMQLYCSECGAEAHLSSYDPGYVLCNKCRTASLAAARERMKGDPSISFTVGNRVSVNCYGSPKTGTVEAIIDVEEGYPKRYWVSIDGGNPNLIAEADDWMESYHGDMSPLAEEPRHPSPTIPEFSRQMARRYQRDGVAT